jgi:hypothetical protein
MISTKLSDLKEDVMSQMQAQIDKLIGHSITEDLYKSDASEFGAVFANHV